MSNIILTVSGASFMNQAGASGPYIPIKYFVPVYDHRYDSYVHPTSALIPVSAGDFTSAVSPFGDIIWNMDSLTTSAYSISNQEFLIFDPNQLGTSTITGSRFDATSFITLKSGTPISNSISATSFVYNYPNWTVNGYTLVNGNGNIPSGYSSSRDKYFNSVSYSPISSAAGGSSRGLFKVRIGNQTGNFKFNKVALYAAKILANGTEDTSVEPVLFGVAMLKEPIIKSNDGFNISYFELDVELQFSSNGYFSQTLFTNNTEWTIAGDNLWWDRRIIIGSSAVPGSYKAYAKVHIVEPNPAVPMERITNDNDDSYIDRYLSEIFYSNDETHKSSKPVFGTFFETSGSSKYSNFQLYLNTVNASRYFGSSFVDPISGAINTGWSSTYGGYVETSEFTFDSNTLATFRSSNSVLGSLVLGFDSSNLFQHPNKFLTVHGGALLVGSCQVSGSVSGNGQWYTNSLLLGATLDVNGVVTANAGIVYHVGLVASGPTLSTFGTTRTDTSALMVGPLTFLNTISGNGDLYAHKLTAASDVVAHGYLVGDSGVLAFGLDQVSIFDELRVNTSAHFSGPVTINNNFSVAGSIFSSNAYITGTIAGTIGAFNQTFINDSVNVSGVAAFGSNIDIDNGDLLIRGVSKGIKINTTGSNPTAGRTLLPNGVTNVTINTAAVNANSIILYTLEGNLVNTTSRLTKTNGVSFTVWTSQSTVDSYVDWLIINPTP